MIKQLLLIITLLFVSSSTKEQKVYVCTGSWSKCYHIDKDCYGLSNCGGTTKEITLEEAKKMGRNKPCGYCIK